MPGRKPTALKILDGDQPCRINLNEPESEPGLGDPPPWLSDDELRAWHYFIEIVPALVLTRADRLSAEMFAQAYVDLNRERSQTHPHPPTVTAYRKQVMQILAKYGLTASDRAGLKGSKPNSKLAEVYANRNKKKDRKKVDQEPG